MGDGERAGVHEMTGFIRDGRACESGTNVAGPRDDRDPPGVSKAATKTCGGP